MKHKRKRRSHVNDTPMGRIELLGTVIHLVETDDHFDLVGVKPGGEGTTMLFSSRSKSQFECVLLMHNAVEMLRSVMDTAAATFEKLVADGQVRGEPERVREVNHKNFGPFSRFAAAPRAPSPHENN